MHTSRLLLMVSRVSHVFYYMRSVAVTLTIVVVLLFFFYLFIPLLVTIVVVFAFTVACCLMAPFNSRPQMKVNTCIIIIVVCLSVCFFYISDNYIVV